MKRLAIYGAGGFGRELAWLAEVCGNYHLLGFIDDSHEKHKMKLNGLPVMDIQTIRKTYMDAVIVTAIGNPKTRKMVVENARKMGCVFESLIHPRVEISKWVELGEGIVICSGNILTTNIRIGQHVHINLDCTIGHDVIIGDYVTLSPGVHVSGYVHIGSRVYVGTGAVIINGLANHPIVIGDDVVIGAGAVVTKSVLPECTVGGVPARSLK
jgi:sugar O-acyltransferase (sialic acid O-acetyltransferase NeuD family)